MPREWSEPDAHDVELQRLVDDAPDDSPPDLQIEAPAEEAWSPPPSFFWMQIAIMTNVFLGGFDSTITASTYAVISSEFDSANTASWLTTSYLVTSAAFQPLYGRVSDILGRRACFFLSTITFGLGCLGCGVASNVVLLNCMRALAGFGGGGLMTMATIINSDMIPFRKRGMYQAMQNGVFGFGSICGAAFGGAIADSIGWRWCFLAQVPLSIAALIFGAIVLRNPKGSMSLDDGISVIWQRVDFFGACLLVVAISSQLLALSLGGNQLPWSSFWVIGSLILSLVLFGVFIWWESKTTALPIIPLRMLVGRLPVLTQISNVLCGLSAYAYLFMLPLFFQSVLMESASRAGGRLAIPSLATPLGGVIAGVVMSRWGKLLPLLRTGAILMTIGNFLVMTFAFEDSSWKYLVYIFPANLGQGIVYPSILFTSLATFEHTDHAVCASTVYLVRSLGNVWGVSFASAILQTTLSARLPEALGAVPNKWRVIEDIRHSVDALHSLPPEVQLQARHVYYDGIVYAFGASGVAAALAVVTSCCISGAKLRKTH